MENKKRAAGPPTYFFSHFIIFFLRTVSFFSFLLYCTVLGSAALLAFSFFSSHDAVRRFGSELAFPMQHWINNHRRACSDILFVITAATAATAIAHCSFAAVKAETSGLLDLLFSLYSPASSLPYEGNIAQRWKQYQKTRGNNKYMSARLANSAN